MLPSPIHANKFSNLKYVTTDAELQNIITKCPRCYKLTLYGSLIIPQTALPNIRLPLKKQKKFFMIIHLQSSSSSSNIGHWLSACIYTLQSYAIIIDPSNNFHKNAITTSLLKQFCKNNNLRLFNFDTLLESKSSVICGQICLFFCMKTENHSFTQMLDLRSILRNHSTPFNEWHMLKFVEMHYKVTF